MGICFGQFKAAAISSSLGRLVSIFYHCFGWEELHDLPQRFNIMNEKQVPQAADAQSIVDDGSFADNVIDPKTEKQVVRKIDRVVLPLMAVIYFFQCKLVTFTSRYSR